jgi:hypothetical protein
MATNENTGENLGAVITDPMVRRMIYSAYVVLLIVAGAAQAGFAALHQTTPGWLAVVLAVLGYLGVPVGGLAVANTKNKAPAAAKGAVPPTVVETEPVAPPHVG